MQVRTYRTTPTSLLKTTHYDRKVSPKIHVATRATVFHDNFLRLRSPNVSAF